MKLAITTQTPDVNSPIDPRFGRARYFRIVDTETGQQSTADNSDGVNAVQGAGIQAAQKLSQLGVQTVLTGHVGPKAWSALQASGIQAFAISDGTAEQAVQSFLEGKLRAVSGAGVPGHG